MVVLLTDAEIDEVVEWQLHLPGGNYPRPMYQSIPIPNDGVGESEYVDWEDPFLGNDAVSWPVPREQHDLDIRENFVSLAGVLEANREMYANGTLDRRVGV